VLGAKTRATYHKVCTGNKGHNPGTNFLCRKYTLQLLTARTKLFVETPWTAMNGTGTSGGTKCGEAKLMCYHFSIAATVDTPSLYRAPACNFLCLLATDVARAAT